MCALPQIGVLVCNLGTPEGPTAGDLRPYLREFLSDRRVVEMPRIQWLPILYSFILPFRPRKSAKLYQEIWTKEGSPLLVLSRKVRDGIEQALQREGDPTISVELGMRYGNPSIGSALQTLREAGCGRILVLPLYPQYSASTAASTFDAVWDELKSWRVVPEIRSIREYGADPGYIAALAASIRELWHREGEPEKLLLSFHGIPKRYADSGDPYPEQCQETARLLFAELGAPVGQCEVSFQSVFGREEWIQPPTDKTVERLAQSGVRSLDVVCPGFSVDCLETLEEINGQNREIFLEGGGAQFRYIPCLNDREDHVDTLARLIRRNLDGWIPLDPAAVSSIGGL